MKFVISLAVLAAISFGLAQQGVVWREWNWQPSDQAEVMKVLNGKPSKTFKVTPTMRREIVKFKKAGYRHLYIIPTGKKTHWPFLSKKRIKKPTYLDMQNPASLYPEILWNGKAWYLYVTRDEGCCP